VNKKEKRRQRYEKKKKKKQSVMLASKNMSVLFLHGDVVIRNAKKRNTLQSFKNST